MKKAICVLLAAAMLSMTGCSTIPQPTMEEIDERGQRGASGN